eukprot:6198060-Pleurochrysis_carterae.AAC.2
MIRHAEMRTIQLTSGTNYCNAKAVGHWAMMRTGHYEECITLMRGDELRINFWFAVSTEGLWEPKFAN